jgi:rhodanese-related sulfurtransferase
VSNPDKPLPPEIHPEELQAWCHAGHCVQIVDVRSGGEFAGGRISGAQLLPLAELGGRVDELERETPVVVICQSGKRGAQARGELHRLGWTNVANLAGGMGAWTEAGLPVEKDARAPWALERQVRVAAGTLVLLGMILGFFVHAGFFGLSAFVGAGLIFAGVTDWCGMGLLLARAPWNRRSL